jgi:hypothetical protein
MRQREGLIARVRQIRVAAAASDVPAPSAAAPPGPPTLDELETRMAHLEEQLRGFQDSVHRENVRQEGRIADLEARLEPAALAVALSRDARERGL